MITKSLGKAEKIAGGSQTAFLIRIVAETNDFFVNPFQTFRLLLGDAALSRLVSSDIGQRVLLEGFSLDKLTNAGKSIKNISESAGKVGGALRVAELSKG